MGESVHSNLSILSNNLRLLSYTRALSLPPRRVVEKYYFIMDKVSQGGIPIEHCPTKQMWTDINTKPKQGFVFCVFRGHVVGIPADY
jgi:hypothetical protein